MPTLECPGMRADNPLGFLAAIGFLRALECEFPSCTPRLAWANDHAVIHTETPLPDDWATILADALKNHAAAILPDPPRPIIKTDIAAFRKEARVHLEKAHESATGWRRLAVELQAGMATDSMPPDPKENSVEISSWSFANGGSGKNLLKDIRTLLSAAEPDRINRAVNGEYDAKSDESLPTVRWDPAEYRPYGYRAINPTDATPPATPRLLQLFAFLALSNLPVFTEQATACTTGVVDNQRDHNTKEEGGYAFRWPIWTTPLINSEITIILSAISPAGITAYYASRRFSADKSTYFAPSVAVPIG